MISESRYINKYFDGQGIFGNSIIIQTYINLKRRVNKMARSRILLEQKNGIIRCNKNVIRKLRNE